MADDFLAQLRARFGLPAPPGQAPLSTFEGTNPIERALRIAQGERFAPEEISGTPFDPDGGIAAAIRGFQKVGDLGGQLGSFGAPQEALRQATTIAPDPTPTLGEGLIEGAVSFAPLLIGSAGAGLAVAGGVGGGLFSSATPALSVISSGLTGAPGFFLAENVATGIVADAALDHPIGPGIVYSAIGTGLFTGMAAAFKATGKLPKFALEQASEAQKNVALRQLARDGIDPRATDLANDITEAGRAVDGITGGATQLEKQTNALIFQVQKPPTRKPMASLSQFTDEVLDQTNLTEVLGTRTNADVAEKTTVNLGLAKMLETEEIVKKLGGDLGQTFDILDRVSPTVTASERLAVLNGNLEVFSEVSRRWGTPDENVRRVIEAAQGPDMPVKLLDSLREQALIHRIKGRIDVVNPAFNGGDAVARQFMKLPVEARTDIVKVLKAFGMDTADPALGKSMVEFDARIQRFFEKGGGEGKVNPFTDTSRVTDEVFEPKLPPLGRDLESDVLRGVLRTAPSKAAAERALTPGQDVGKFTTQAASDIGVRARAGRARKILANGVPLPVDPIEAGAVRQTLLDIADLYFESKPHVAIQAVRTLKSFDQAQKIFADTFTEIGTELGKFDGPLGDFARNRFTLEGDFLGTRLLMSNALDASSAHYPELDGSMIRDIFGARAAARSLVISPPGQGVHARAASTPAFGVRSFASVQRHEFGHEIHSAMKNSANPADRDLASAIELAAHRQPYRNDDWSFREMTGAPMGPNNTWLKPHADPLKETVAELISNLSSAKGRAHIHPGAREILEGAGIRIQEPYKPNRPAFQFGLSDVDSGISRITGKPVGQELPLATLADEAPSLGALGKAIAAKFPGKGPSAKVAGNAAVGPRGLGAQQEEVTTNAVAALSRVTRADVGQEKQIGLFTNLADEGLKIVRPSKANQDLLKKQLGVLGSDALQTFNESLITLPRSAQGKFVQRFIEDGDKVLGASFQDYTRAIREWRASAMLFGPSTWMVNIFSTMLNTAVRPLTALAAGGIDAARSALTGVERTRFASDALAEIAGLVQGSRDAIHFIKSDIQKLRGKQPVPQNALQELFETGSVLRRGGLREAVFQGSDAAFLFSKGAATRGFAKPVGGGIQVPFEILRISDNALYNMNFTGEMYRLAGNELKRAGKPFSLKEVGRMVEGRARESAALRKKAGEFAETEMQKNFGEGYLRSDGSLPVPLKALQDDMIQKALLDSVPANINEAKEIAKKTIFLARETGYADKMLTKLDEADDFLGGAVSIALPFRRTPMNLLREGIRTSPLGFLATGELIGGIVGTVPKTVEELTDAYAQAAVGTLLYAGLTALAMYGVLEGNPEHFEQNRAVRTTMLADGRRPETVFVNLEFTKLSIPLTRLQPIGGLVLGALRASETIKDEGLKTIRPDVLFGTQVEFIKSLGLQDQVEGTADLLEALVSDDPRKNFAERFGASFVPAFIRQSRQAIPAESGFFGPQGRASKTTEANVVTRFLQGASAGAFNSGLPKLGLFGEAVKRTPGPAGAFGVSSIGQDPVVTAMIDAGAFHQSPDILPQLREGTADQKNDFIRGKGQLQKKFVTKAIEGFANFAELPQEKRKRIIDSAFTRASNIANRRGRNALQAGAAITPQLILTGKLGL